MSQNSTSLAADGVEVVVFKDNGLGRPFASVRSGGISHRFHSFERWCSHASGGETVLFDGNQTEATIPNWFAARVAAEMGRVGLDVEDTR